MPPVHCHRFVERRWGHLPGRLRTYSTIRPSRVPRSSSADWFLSRQPRVLNHCADPGTQDDRPSLVCTYACIHMHAVFSSSSYLATSPESEMTELIAPRGRSSPKSHLQGSLHRTATLVSRRPPGGRKTGPPRLSINCLVPMAHSLRSALLPHRAARTFCSLLHNL